MLELNAQERLTIFDLLTTYIDQYLSNKGSMIPIEQQCVFALLRPSSPYNSDTRHYTWNNWPWPFWLITNLESNKCTKNSNVQRIQQTSIMPTDVSVLLDRAPWHVTWQRRLYSWHQRFSGWPGLHTFHPQFSWVHIIVQTSLFSLLSTKFIYRALWLVGLSVCSSVGWLICWPVHLLLVSWLVCWTVHLLLVS